MGGRKQKGGDKELWFSTIKEKCGRHELSPKQKDREREREGEGEREKGRERKGERKSERERETETETERNILRCLCNTSRLN